MKKEVLKKYNELLDVNKNEIKTINGGKESEYGKDFMKIKLYTDGDLPLNKLLNLHMLTIILDVLLKKTVNVIPKFIRRVFV